jgi:hypothetical protein
LDGGCSIILFSKSILEEVFLYNGITWNGVNKNMEKMKQDENLKKLHDIGELRSNWDGYNAPGFDNALIKKAQDIIKKLKVQPEMFPIPGGAIQFEYEKATGDYLEIEISMEATASVLRIVTGGEEEFEIDASEDIIKKLVDEFYE